MSNYNDIWDKRERTNPISVGGDNLKPTPKSRKTFYSEMKPYYTEEEIYEMYAKKYAENNLMTYEEALSHPAVKACRMYIDMMSQRQRELDEEYDAMMSYMLGYSGAEIPRDKGLSIENNSET